MGGDEPFEQSAELVALGRREWREQGFLGRLDAGFETRQDAFAAGRKRDHVAAAVSIVPNALDETVSLELVEDRVEVAAIDPQAAAELGLARGTLLGERCEDREVWPAHAFTRELVTHQPLGPARNLTREPARQLPQAARRVVTGLLIWLRHMKIVPGFPVVRWYHQRLMLCW